MILRAVILQSRVLLTLLALILVAGWAAYRDIPKESNPDIPIPTMYVSVSLDGISPEDAVNLLIKPMETELRGLAGLDEMTSTAYEGGGNIVVTFDAGFDPRTALADVREKVDSGKAELPAEADEPRVFEVNMAEFPVLQVILRGDVSERTLKNIAEDLRDRLESLPGVLEVPVAGLREEMLLIEVDMAKLESFKLPPQAILNVVSMNNRLVAAGSLEMSGGKYAIKVPGLFKTREDVLNLPLLTSGDRIVRVRDVGDVRLTFKDASSLARVDGQPAVTLGIKKRIGVNLIETVDTVKAVVAQDAKNWPAGVTYRFSSDESKNIRSMVGDLENNIMIAVLLVMLFVLQAVGWRTSTLVALTVPGSFLLTMLILYFAGFSTNVVILFTLILTAGMVVDNGIVVAEYADNLLARGVKPKDAYVRAAQEMARPVFAGTITILVVFMPLLFWPDVVGEFMRYMPITMLATLSASWLMAMVFLPAVGVAWPQKRPPKPMDEGNGFYATLANHYDRLIRWSLRHPGKVVLATLAGLVGIIALYATAGPGVEFFPRIEPERANVNVTAKGDLSLQEKDEIMREVERRIGRPEGVETLITEVGGGGGRQDAGSQRTGQIVLDYVDWADGRPRSEDILNHVRAAIGDMPGIEVEAVEPRDGPSQGKPVEIRITGDSFALIEPVARQVRAELENVPGVRNIEDNLPDPGIEWRLQVDRDAVARIGSNLAEVGQMIRLGTNGAIIGAFRPDGSREEIDIIVRLKQEQRSLEALSNLTVPAVNTPTGRVPIRDLTTRTAQPKVTTITRIDQNYAVTVGADVAPDVLASDVVKQMEARLKEVQQATPLPRGVAITFAGEAEDTTANTAFLEYAFFLGLAVMGLILLVTFNSFYQVLVILSAVLFSTIGVFLGHLIFNKPFGIIMSGVGIIALAGTIVNNNIVLIDTYNSHRRVLPWRDALLRTGRERLRPVLLTAATTVVAILPLAFRVNFDVARRTITYDAPSSQWWDQLATAVAVGTTFATILTLVVTPCMLALGEIFMEKWRARYGQPDGQA